MSETDGLTSGLSNATRLVDQLISKFRTLSTAISDASSKSSNLGSNLKTGSFGGGGGTGGVGSSGSGTKLTGMAQFTYGVGQVASGMAKGMPDVNQTIGYARGYYGAATMAGMPGHKAMERATFSAVAAGGGMTSVGADANSAAYLASRGMNYSGNPNSTYMQTMKTAATLGRYLNVPLEQGAQAIEGLTSAQGASGMLRTYGIYTSDLATGKEKTMPQIFGELAGRLSLRQSTGERTAQSFRKGALSVVRNQLAGQYGETTAQLFQQYMIDRAEGKSTDWVNNKNLGKGNPMSAEYALNASQTKQLGKAEDSYLAGIQAVIPAITTLNDIFGEMAKNVGGVNAGLQVAMGSNSVQGAWDIGKGLGNIFQGLWSAKKGGGGTSSMRTMPGMAGRGTGGNDGGSSWADVSGLTSHSVNEGFGSNRGTKTHGGIDYAYTPNEQVKAIADGVVYNVVKGQKNAPGSGSLGNQVEILHQNGKETYTSIYGHLQEVYVVKDKPVKKGDVIGTAGNTGDSSGTHLHFELRKGKYLTGAGSGEGGHPDTWAGDLVGLTGGSGQASNSSSQTSSGTVTSGASSNAGNNGTYTGAASVVTGGLTGVSAMDNSATSSLGISALASALPPALNGSSFGGQSVGKSSGYKSNAPGRKTGDAYVAQDGPVNVHAGEAILTESEASEWRSSRALGKGGSGNNVTINVTVAQASETEARRFAKLIKGYLKEEAHMSKMGRL